MLLDIQLDRGNQRVNPCSTDYFTFLCCMFNKTATDIKVYSLPCVLLTWEHRITSNLPLYCNFFIFNQMDFELVHKNQPSFSRTAVRMRRHCKRSPREELWMPYPWKCSRAGQMGFWATSSIGEWGTASKLPVAEEEPEPKQSFLHHGSLHWTHAC